MLIASQSQYTKDTSMVAAIGLRPGDGTCSTLSMQITTEGVVEGPPLWSSGQSFWLQIQRSRVRFPALPDFLSSSGSGTGSTQPREFN